MDGLVSVIIPVYNVESYVGRCIESILGQTYENLEIILINDGSKDNSLEVCRKYANRDSRIRIVSQQNAGCSAARNTGLSIATGQYISFVDSDDYVHSEYIEYLLDLCKRYNCQVSQVQYTYVYDDPSENSWQSIVRASLNKNEEHVIEKKWTFQDLFTSKSRSYRVIACGKLYSRELFETYRFPVGKLYEDEDASFFLGYNAQNLVISSRHMYFYFMSQGSITRNNNNYVNWDFLDHHKKIISFLEENNDVIMLNVERKELCIRLMLRYFKSVKNKYDRNDINLLKQEFDLQYSQIQKNKYIPNKEWILLSLYSMFPSFVTSVINATGVVQKAKIKRIQHSK